MSDQYLFSNGDLYDQISRWGEDLRKAILNYSADALLNASVDSLVEHFTEEFSTSPLRLLEDDITAGQTEIDVDISRDPMRHVIDRNRPYYIRGTKFLFHVPFEGEAGFFKLRAQSFSLNGVRANVVGNELVFGVTQLKPDPDSAQAEFDRQLQTVRSSVASQGSQLSQYHQQLPNTIRQLVETRREKLLADRQAVAGLRYPIRARPDSTYATSALSRRQPLRPATPKPRPGGNKPFVPEPVLTDDDFAAIVQIVSSMTKVMERSPSAFVRATEETIRDHILVQLNGHFEGNALGEAFNAAGKTDILVRENDRNLFIGECKFWKGKQSLGDALDQLMSYLTWRDAKALLIILNRTTQMSTVLATVESEMPNHPAHARGMKRVDETSFVSVLKRSDDADREIQLRVLVMNVPSTSPTKRSKESPESACSQALPTTGDRCTS